MTDNAAPPPPLLLPGGAPALTAWTLDPSVVHLNHGSFGAVPRAALEVQSMHRRRMERNPVGWMPTQSQRIARVRPQLAAYLGTPAEGLAMVPNASASASVVFNAQPLRPGDEVLITDHGYGALNRGAARIARQAGAHLRVARIRLDSTAEEAAQTVMDSVTDRTRLLVIDQITSATALRLPVGAITQGAALRGVRTLVDGAHSPGLIDRPLDGLTCDYWIGNFHKFGCAPRGAAVLVAAPEVAQDLQPLIDSWNAELPFPERFDMQGTLDHTSYLAAPTAWEFLQDTWGWDRIRGHMAGMVAWGADLVAAAFEQATGQNHRVDAPMACEHMRLVRLPSPLGSAEETLASLRQRLFEECAIESTVTSFDGVGYIRFSAHAYTTAGDFEAFADRAVPALLRWARQSPAV